MGSQDRIEMSCTNETPAATLGRRFGEPRQGTLAGAEWRGFVDGLGVFSVGSLYVSCSRGEPSQWSLPIKQERTRNKQLALM